MTVKELIAEKGMKQIRVAKEIGVNHCTFNLFLNGFVKLKEKHLKKLAEVLGTEIDAIKTNSLKI